MKGIATLTSMTLLSIAAAFSVAVYFSMSKKTSKLSPWQLTIEKTLRTKKAGSFKATDKAGVPVILEWIKTNVHEPEYAETMRRVEKVLTQAFVPVQVQFLKTHPELILNAKKNDSFQVLKPLFINGAALVDWNVVEEMIVPVIQDQWRDQINLDETAMNRLAHLIYIFIMAKDPITEKLLGFILYSFDNNDPLGGIELEPLVIAPEEQNRGLGKLLVSSIFRILPQITLIGLGTMKTNTAAIAAYTAMGFRELPTKADDRSVPMLYKVEQSDILQNQSNKLLDN